MFLHKQILSIIFLFNVDKKFLLQYISVGKEKKGSAVRSELHSLDTEAELLVAFRKGSSIFVKRSAYVQRQSSFFCQNKLFLRFIHLSCIYRNLSIETFRISLGISWKFQYHSPALSTFSSCYIYSTL